LGNLVFQRNPDEWVLVDLKGAEDFLKNSSRNKVIGLSLLAHSLRFMNWKVLQQILLYLSSIEIIEPMNSMKELVNESFRILTDRRVLKLFCDISGISTSRIEEILQNGQIKVDFVDSEIPMKGWVTPIGIVLNSRMINRKEKESNLIFARLVGHEFTHFLCRMNSSFGLSTPEGFKLLSKESPFYKLISKLREKFEHVDNHIESGLIFEISFFGEKFSFRDTCPNDLIALLETNIKNTNHSLPLIDVNTALFPTEDLNEQFAFYPADSKEFYY
jgi:hypothetical protein